MSGESFVKLSQSWGPKAKWCSWAIERKSLWRVSTTLYSRRWQLKGCSHRTTSIWARVTGKHFSRFYRNWTRSLLLDRPSTAQSVKTSFVLSRCSVDAFKRHSSLMNRSHAPSRTTRRLATRWVTCVNIAVTTPNLTVTATRSTAWPAHLTASAMFVEERHTTITTSLWADVSDNHYKLSRFICSCLVRV